LTNTNGCFDLVDQSALLFRIVGSHAGAQAEIGIVRQANSVVDPLHTEQHSHRSEQPSR
jgi:hypothetical protein